MIIANISLTGVVTFGDVSGFIGPLWLCAAQEAALGPTLLHSWGDPLGEAVT